MIDRDNAAHISFTTPRTDFSSKENPAQNLGNRVGLTAKTFCRTHSPQNPGENLSILDYTKSLQSDLPITPRNRALDLAPTSRYLERPHSRTNIAKPSPFKDKYSKPSPIEEFFLKILPDQGFFPAPSPIEDTTLPVWLLNLKNLPFVTH